MKRIVSLIFLLLIIASCGQEPRSRRVSSEGSDTNDFQVQNCSQQSGIVCGQPPMPQCQQGFACATVMPNPVSYANECEMMSAGAQFIQNGQCPSTTL